MLRLSIPLLVGCLAAACSETPIRGSVAQPADPTATTAEGEGAGLEPVSDWRSERKRIAMLGLDYSTGRVVPTAEARTVLSGLDAGDVPALLEEGRLAFAENRALDAIPAFTRVVLLEPQVAEHYVELGTALYSFKLEPQAIAAYETGMELDPQDAELVFHVADMADRLGDDERALTLYERAVAIDANHGRAWGRLARLHYYAQEDDAAWVAVHQAEANGEDMPVVLRNTLASRTPEPAR